MQILVKEKKTIKFTDDEIEISSLESNEEVYD